MERDVAKSRDALQHRLARFIAEAKAPCAVGGSEGVWIGTSVGAVRGQNEDRALVTFASYQAAPRKDFILGVLCDGIGGLSRGADAAVFAISVFVSRFLRTSKLSYTERLRNAALVANDAVYAMLNGGGGATLSAILINGEDQPIGVNVGDSRIYAISHAGQLTQLSQDDTLAGMVGKQDDGSGQNQLLQFLGMGEGIEPHIITTNKADVSTILVTSDGIHGAPPDAFAQVVRNAPADSTLIKRLIELSEALGGRDNSTVFALPTHIEARDLDYAQGLNLTFLSPSDRLEIWIPVLADDVRQERLPSALTDGEEAASHDDVKDIKRGFRPNPKTRASQRRERRSPKKRSTKPGELPLDQADRPPLDVWFPGKRET